VVVAKVALEEGVADEDDAVAVGELEGLLRDWQSRSERISRYFRCPPPQQWIPLYRIS